MKHCPKCQRAYAEETLKFCREDGAPLLDDTAPLETSATVLLPRAEETAVPTSRLTGPRVPSIAVLPFANMSADPENEFFCDGLAEDLINALSKTEGLKVAARTSAFSFKGAEADVQEIGRRLNVATILEGSVRRSGNRLRITVQLVNGADGYHLWSERYDREYKDIFDVQDEITLAVMGALKVRLLGEERSAVLRRYTEDTEAYELFLKGRYHYNKYTPEGWERAIEYFARAAEKEKGYAPAYAGMGFCYGALWYFGQRDPQEIVPQWRAVATRALEIDENLAEAHTTMASILFYHDRDWEATGRAYARAVELNPNFADARWRRAMFLIVMGKFDEAVAEGRRALELDPLSIPVNFFMGWIYWYAGRPEDALGQVRRMIELEPEYYGAYWQRGAICLTGGRYQEAVGALRRAVSLGGGQIVLPYLACAESLAGRGEEARRILGELLKAKGERYVSAFSVARAYSALGEADRVFEWLERALEERNGEMVYLRRETEVGTGDLWACLRGDPRLPAFLSRLGLGR
jgi:adenylate cyclase